MIKESTMLAIANTGIEYRTRKYIYEAHKYNGLTYIRRIEIGEYYIRRKYVAFVDASGKLTKLNNGYYKKFAFGA